MCIFFLYINGLTNSLPSSSLMASTHLTAKNSTRSSPNLRTEYDRWRSKEFYGEGSAGEGRRVGEGVSHNVSPHEARRKVLGAADHGEDSTVLWVGWGGSLEAVLK